MSLISFQSDAVLAQDQAKEISILTMGNSWVYNNPEETRTVVTKQGIENWESTNTKIRTYFKLENTGELKISLVAKNSNNSSVKVTLNGKSEEVSISSDAFSSTHVGTFKIDKPGYHFIELQGVRKNGDHFGEVSEIVIEGEATKGNMYYVKEDFYWGRRGPSVHVSYEVPSEAGDIKYFYNEMTIPKDNDVIGSYFMANGFAEGYFGIQVNSETERRILFSVWSPFKTDDPTSIPKDQKIILLKKGKDVISNDFGNEGSGGQSRKVFEWKSDTTYKFLLKAEPSVNNSTDYSAYFYAPETGEWELIASFRRPKTSTYVKRPHSFLENFIPSMGDQTRRVYYNNQWLIDTNGTWYGVSKMKFTADATARKESRLDYAGGVQNNTFYLQNCGFFDETTRMNTLFSKSIKNEKPPVIDFEKLP